MRHPVSDRVFRHGFGASIREWSESNRQDTRFIFGRISHGCASWIRTNTGNCISTSIRLGVEQKPSSTFNHASFSQFGYRAIHGRSMRNRTSPRGFGDRIASLGTCAPIYPLRGMRDLRPPAPRLNGVLSFPRNSKTVDYHARFGVNFRFARIAPTLRMLGGMCRPCVVIIHSTSYLESMQEILSNRTVNLLWIGGCSCRLVSLTLTFNTYVFFPPCTLACVLSDLCH